MRPTPFVAFAVSKISRRNALSFVLAGLGQASNTASMAEPGFAARPAAARFFTAGIYSPRSARALETAGRRAGRRHAALAFDAGGDALILVLRIVFGEIFGHASGNRARRRRIGRAASQQDQRCQSGRRDESPPPHPTISSTGEFERLETPTD